MHITLLQEYKLLYFLDRVNLPNTWHLDIQINCRGVLAALKLKEKTINGIHLT